MFEKEMQQILDLIDNKEFIRWLILPDEQSDGYWHNIMETDGNKRKRSIAAKTDCKNSC
jgi:hypothetical protein